MYIASVNLASRSVAGSDASVKSDPSTVAKYHEVGNLEVCHGL